MRTVVPNEVVDMATRCALWRAPYGSTTGIGNQDAQWAVRQNACGSAACGDVRVAVEFPSALARGGTALRSTLRPQIAIGIAFRIA